MASLDDAGLNIDTLEQVLAAINQAMLDEFGTGPNGIDLSPRSYTGRQNPIIAEQIVQLQQLQASVLAVINPDNASGRILDFVGTLFDEDRNEAQRASLPSRCYGVPGFVIGDRRIRYIRNSTIWRVPAGTAIGGSGFVDVTLQADVAGLTLTDGTPIQAFQDGTGEWVIVDASPSFTAVESLADSADGSDVEGPTSYRARLRLAGRSSGTGTAPGVRRAITRVAGSSARVDNNRALTPNANGVPGKSIETIVEAGSDDDVAQAIYDSYSDTAGFFGTNAAGTATDINGDPVTVPFTRAENIEIIWDVAITTAGAEAPLPDDAATVIQNALAAYTNATLMIGSDVIPLEGAAALVVSLPAGSIPDGGLMVKVAAKGSLPAASPVVITSRQRATTNPAAQPARIVGTTSQPFNLLAGQTLDFAVNAGTPQSVTFAVTDFAAISAATALEVATAINNRTTGIVAGSQNGALTLRTESTGSAASLDVNSTTPALLTTLGLVAGTVTGSDGDITVTIS